MSVELISLLWSAPLGIAYIMVQAFFMNKDSTGGIDPKRDREPQLGVKAQRASRALRNFLESYGIFVALVVVVEISNRHGMLTSIGAVLYVVARIFYLPLYIAGIGPVRSAVWSLSLLGLLLMFAGAMI